MNEALDTVLEGGLETEIGTPREVAGGPLTSSPHRARSAVSARGLEQPAEEPAGAGVDLSSFT